MADVGPALIAQDATLKRCFGRKETIANCDWDYLSSLRTVRAPHEPMPRLVDLLAYLAQPGLEEIWLLLDIKVSKSNLPLMDRDGSHGQIER